MELIIKYKNIFSSQINTLKALMEAQEGTSY